MGLRIAVIGFNKKLTNDIIRKIAEDSKKTIKQNPRGTFITDGGIIYQNISDFDECNLMKINFDQLIIADDYRWAIFEKQYDLIELVKNLLQYSCVPEEYQVQKFEV